MNESRIKVLITDDSMLFREILAKGLESHPDIQVVAKASDPFDARDKILKYEPDVMICDIQMPKMSGIEFIKRLIPQYPLPVIVVSTLNNVVFDALNAGAVDFVLKPDVRSTGNMESFINEIISKVLIAKNAKVLTSQNTKPVPVKRNERSKFNIIAIGASTGGTEAVYRILKELPEDMPGIVVVQHIPPVFSTMFSERLNSNTNFNVSEGKNGDIIETGKVIIAPGNKQMEVRKKKGVLKIVCYDGDKKAGHCPSVDVLFSSVAEEVKSEAIGVILTGMGRDGTQGLLKMRFYGAKTIGQDESTSVVYGMPKSAYEAGAVQIQAKLENIPDILVSIIK